MTNDLTLAEVSANLSRALGELRRVFDRASDDELAAWLESQAPRGLVRKWRLLTRDFMNESVRLLDEAEDSND
jgi:hypothetical protein